MSATEASPSPQATALHWDDADPASGTWWLARARDSASGPSRDLFIAEDDMTEALVGLVRIPPQSHYTVLAAVFLEGFESRAAAAAILKENIVRALGPRRNARDVRSVLRRWRLVRTAKIARANLPFVLLGLCAGGLLGLAVALFTAWTQFVGWPMVAAGIILGGAAGLLLKLAVEVTGAKAMAGPWARFALIMAGATVGAGGTAGGALLYFWH